MKKDSESSSKLMVIGNDMYIDIQPFSGKYGDNWDIVPVYDVYRYDSLDMLRNYDIIYITNAVDLFSEIKILKILGASLYPYGVIIIENFNNFIDNILQKCNIKSTNLDFKFKAITKIAELIDLKFVKNGRNNHYFMRSDTKTEFPSNIDILDYLLVPIRYDWTVIDRNTQHSPVFFTLESSESVESIVDLDASTLPLESDNGNDVDDSTISVPRQKKSKYVPSMSLPQFKNLHGPTLQRNSCYMDSIITPIMATAPNYLSKSIMSSKSCTGVKNELAIIRYNMLYRPELEITTFNLASKLYKCSNTLRALIGTGEKQDDSEFLMALMDKFDIEPTTTIAGKVSILYYTPDESGGCQLVKCKSMNEPIVDSDCLIFNISRNMGLQYDNTPVDVSRYIELNDKSFELLFATVFIGPISGGHYMAYFRIKEEYNDQWYLYDNTDPQFRKVQWDTVKSHIATNGSMIVYEQME